MQIISYICFDIWQLLLFHFCKIMLQYVYHIHFFFSIWLNLYILTETMCIWFPFNAYVMYVIFFPSTDFCTFLFHFSYHTIVSFFYRKIIKLKKNKSMEWLKWVFFFVLNLLISFCRYADKCIECFFLYVVLSFVVHFFFCGDYLRFSFSSRVCSIITIQITF